MQNPRLERRDGHYRIRLVIAGRRRNFVCGRIADGRKAAEKRRREILHQADHSRLCAPDKVTFQTLVDRFREVRFPQLAMATQRAYDYCLGHLLPEIGPCPVAELSRLSVEQLLARKSKTLAWHSVDQLLRTLRAILNSGVDWNLIPANPCARIRHGKRADRFGKRILPPADLQTLLASLDADTGRLVRLLVTSGLRISEAAALRWSDLDPVAETIIVRRKFYRGDLGEPKSPASKRVRWIGGLAQQLLSARNGDGDGFIFGDGDHPIDEKNLLRRRLRPVLKSLGLYTPGAGWHAFRRWHITMLQSIAGASSIEASKLNGHTTVIVTANYTLVAPDREKQLVRGLVAAVTG
jgi:integrase